MQLWLAGLEILRRILKRELVLSACNYSVIKWEMSFSWGLCVPECRKTEAGSMCICLYTCVCVCATDQPSVVVRISKFSVCLWGSEDWRQISILGWEQGRLTGVRSFCVVSRAPLFLVTTLQTMYDALLGPGVYPLEGSPNVKLRKLRPKGTLPASNSRKR